MAERTPTAAPATTMERLLAGFDGVESACVAFSGGVDSSLVLAAAVRALGPARVVAFTAVSPTYLDAELAAARAVAASLGVEHVVAATHEFDDPRYVANSRERCYHCKAGLLDEMARVAATTCTTPRPAATARAVVSSASR